MRVCLINPNQIKLKHAVGIIIIIINDKDFPLRALANLQIQEITVLLVKIIVNYVQMKNLVTFITAQPYQCEEEFVVLERSLYLIGKAREQDWKDVLSRLVEKACPSTPVNYVQLKYLETFITAQSFQCKEEFVVLEKSLYLIGKAREQDWKGCSCTVGSKRPVSPSLVASFETRYLALTSLFYAVFIFSWF